jgi:hypothetical protein
VSTHFDELVRDALKNLHDVAYLQTHPLTGMVPSEQHVASRKCCARSRPT